MKFKLNPVFTVYFLFSYSLQATWMPSLNLWCTKSQRSGHINLPRKAYLSFQAGRVCVASGLSRDTFMSAKIGRHYRAVWMHVLSGKRSINSSKILIWGLLRYVVSRENHWCPPLYNSSQVLTNVFLCYCTHTNVGWYKNTLPEKIQSGISVLLLLNSTQ